MSDRFTLKAKVEQSSLAKSKNKGTPSVKFLFTVTSKDATFSSIFGDLWLTPNAIQSSLKTLSSVFGWEGDDLSELNSPDLFAGTECEIVCEEEEGQDGNFRPKVVFINKPRSFKPLPTDELNALLSKVNPLLKNARNIGSAGIDAPVASQPAEFSPGDDLPF